jgi:hypothetical protein
MRSTRDDQPPPAGEEAPGLPGLRSWRAVYGFVLVMFVVSIALLAWLGGAGQ